MPLIPGQTTGLFSGIVMVIFFSIVYFVMKFRIGNRVKITPQRGLPAKNFKPGYQTEFSDELVNKTDENDKNK
jgi:hypothetical protein